MKAFEEWDNKNYPYPPAMERGPVNRNMQKQRKHAWRAALEWLRDNEDAHCCGDCDQAGEWIERPMSIELKRELNDEKI